MTAWLISRYHFWRVAVSGASVNDWITDYGTADDSLADVDLLHGSPFVEANEAAEWRRVSPIWYARRRHHAGAHSLRRRRQPRPLSRRRRCTGARYATIIKTPHCACGRSNGHFPTDPVRIVDVYHYWIDYIAQHFQ